MVQVLLPARLLQEAAACAALGTALGAARAFLPVRGRAAFVPDVLLSGAVLLACQSYAAGYSNAGVLRWYMVAAAFAAALCTVGVLGIPLRVLVERVGLKFCHELTAQDRRERQLRLLRELPPLADGDSVIRLAKPPEQKPEQEGSR